ncbi:ankyrin repeat-containing domain protein [Trichoderma asperelloides]|nr:ankyrin repeat-containing domain protein [Trichoderma asperelloides]
MMGDLNHTISDNKFGAGARIHQGNRTAHIQNVTNNYGKPSETTNKRDGEDDILRRLYTTPYEDRKDRNPDRVPGTCEWFISHELFKEWESSKSSRMLWVSADPGCGKSVLVKHLVDSVLQTTESRTVCYFFFKDDFPDQRNIISALCCLLRQLFIRKPLLLSDKIIRQFVTGGETFANSFSELWKLLIQVSKDPNAGEIIYILDAIDECEDQGRSLLARKLCKLYGATNDFQLKFLLTSRPYGKIYHGFRPLEIPGLPVIHLSGESEHEIRKICQEIDIFIKFKVEDIGKRLQLVEEEQNLLLQELMQIPNRTYLWVYLTLDLIETEATSYIPKTVDEAYDRILLKSHDFKQAKKVLHIIVGAIRPLTLKEMNLALLILQHSRRSNSNLELKPENRFRQELRDICGLFITIIDSKIYLLHQTAREFLLQNNKNPIESVHQDFTWKHSLNLLESHNILSKICIWYLLHLEADIYSHKRTRTLRLPSKATIFLDYSAKCWATHFRELHIKTQEKRTQLVLRICDVKSDLFQMWFERYWTSTNTKLPKGFTKLMTVAYFGLQAAVQFLLKQSIDLNSQDHTYQRSALSWAARNGFAVVAKLLVRGARFKLGTIKLPFRKGASVDLVDKYGRTPLSYAVWNGNTTMVELLIDAGAQVHLKDELGGTPMSYAICNQNEIIIDILLQKGGQADVEDDINNLLFSAAKKGDEDLIELLLKTNRVNPNAKDQTNCTPLLHAVKEGHVETVNLLLEKGADPNCKNNNNQTPLLHAVAKIDTATRWVPSSGMMYHSIQAAKRYVTMVGVLLEGGADPKAPFLYVTKRGGGTVALRVLLEKGADPKALLLFMATNYW